MPTETPVQPTDQREKKPAATGTQSRADEESILQRKFSAELLNARKGLKDVIGANAPEGDVVKKADLSEKVSFKPQSPLIVGAPRVAMRRSETQTDNGPDQTDGDDLNDANEIDPAALPEGTDQSVQRGGGRKPKQRAGQAPTDEQPDRPRPRRPGSKRTVPGAQTDQNRETGSDQDRAESASRSAEEGPLPPEALAKALQQQPRPSGSLNAGGQGKQDEKATERTEANSSEPEKEKKASGISRYLSEMRKYQAMQAGKSAGGKVPAGKDQRGTGNRGEGQQPSAAQARPGGIQQTPNLPPAWMRRYAPAMYEEKMRHIQEDEKIRKKEQGRKTAEETGKQSEIFMRNQVLRARRAATQALIGKQMRQLKEAQEKIRRTVRAIRMAIAFIETIVSFFLATWWFWLIAAAAIFLAAQACTGNFAFLNPLAHALGCVVKSST